MIIKSIRTQDSSLVNSGCPVLVITRKRKPRALTVDEADNKKRQNYAVRNKHHWSYPWLFICILFCSALLGCGPKVAISPDYDFKKIMRVGVLKFDSSQVQFFSSYDPGNAVADEFVYQFIRRGVRVVERSRLESIIKEQNLWKSGNIDPDTIKKMGKILGVDALIMGSVTRYIPDRKERIYIKDDEGKLQEEIFLVEAEIGISARMVDVVTGEVVWAGSYVYDSFYINTAIRQAVSAILDALSKVWLVKK